MQGKSKSKTQLSEICDNCGKPRRALRQGSLTSWLFKAETCLCPILESAAEEAEPASTTERRAQRRERAIKKAGSELHLSDRFQILEKLGDGGMGTVYKVQDTSIDETLAVKVLNPVFARDFSKKRRFIREIKALEQLDHSNIVTVYGYGEATNGLPYMVMEYIRGTNLSEKLKEAKTLPEHEALSIFKSICEALDYAHAQGIVHRDLKPSNIMLIQRDDGTTDVKVVDFGISKLRQEGLNRTTNLTQTGEIFGSPYYMSPEQCHGEEIDKRSDIYSLGCLMYEVLTGKPPFHGGNPVGVIMSHIKDRPRPFKRVKPDIVVKPLIEAVVMQCLDKSPQRRFQSMSELSSALTAAGNAERSSYLISRTDKFGKVTYKPAIFALCLVLAVEILFVMGMHRLLPWQLVPRMLGFGNRYSVQTRNGDLYASDKALTLDDAVDELIRKNRSLNSGFVDKVDLTGKSYVGMSFKATDFTNVNFTDAELISCDFTFAKFKKCTFSGALFDDCAMRFARFEDCDFSNTRFKATTFKETTTTNCDFKTAIFDQTINVE